MEAQPQPGLPREIAQVQLAARVGEQQPQHLRAHLGKQDRQQAHVWINLTIVWLFLSM